MSDVYEGKGLGNVPTGNSLAKLKIDAGKAVVIRIATPADEIISVYEHTVQIGGKWRTFRCLGKDHCPLCASGDKGRFQAYLAVIERPENKVKYWKVSATVARQLIALVEEYGDLTARDFKVYRQGEKLQTTYQFFPQDKRVEDFASYEMPDFGDIVPTPQSREDMILAMQGSSASNNNGTPGDADAPGGNSGNSGAGDDNYPF